MILREGVTVAESVDAGPGIVLDYDAVGEIVSIEILDASQRVTDAQRVDFQRSVS